MIAALRLVPVLSYGQQQPNEPECQVRVLQPLTDDLGNHWAPGKVLSVTIERDNAEGGAFCAHGGSCLPRRLHGTAAVELLNCRIGTMIDAEDHRLEPKPQPQPQ